MKGQVAIAAGVLLLLIPGVAAAQGSFSGKVVQILDADILSIERDGGAKTVALFGIDCPEADQNFGDRALAYTTRVCMDKTVEVKVRGPAEGERVAAVVMLPNGRALNDDLVRMGLAWWHKDSAPKAAKLQRLQAQAIMKNKGLWSEHNPTPPWDFRKGVKRNWEPAKDSNTDLNGGGRMSGSIEYDASGAPIMRMRGKKRYTPPTTPYQARRRQREVLDEADGPIVYTTRSGIRYHTEHCDELDHTKKPMTLQDADDRNYAPCPKCAPPRK